MNQYNKLIIYTDGGSRNNPGPAGIGVVIYNERKNILKTYKEYIGEATNNIAEYKALIKGLQLAADYTKGELEIFLDSELIVKQLNGQYKVKEEKMKRLFDEAKVLSMGFENIKYTHIKRELNKMADRLVNEAIDEGVSKSY